MRLRSLASVLESVPAEACEPPVALRDRTEDFLMDVLPPFNPSGGFPSPPFGERCTSTELPREYLSAPTNLVDADNENQLTAYLRSVAAIRTYMGGVLAADPVKILTWAAVASFAV